MQQEIVDQDQDQGERVETATLAVDVVVVDVDPDDVDLARALLVQRRYDPYAAVRVLLVQRRWAPYEGCWALPGGLVEPGEALAAAAVRELDEETGLSLDATELDQVGAYGDPGRDPRGRVVSFAFAVTVTGAPDVTGQDDATDAAWWPVADVLAGRVRLAFDHRQIVADAT